MDTLPKEIREFYIAHFQAAMDDYSKQPYKPLKMTLARGFSNFINTGKMFGYRHAIRIGLLNWHNARLIRRRGA